MTKKELTTKHCMFGQQIYASQENFTQPLVVMVETFRRSAHSGGNCSFMVNQLLKLSYNLWILHDTEEYHLQLIPPLPLKSFKQSNRVDRLMRCTCQSLCFPLFCYQGSVFAVVAQYGFLTIFRRKNVGTTAKLLV